MPRPSKQTLRIAQIAGAALLLGALLAASASAAGVRGLPSAQTAYYGGYATGYAPQQYAGTNYAGYGHPANVGYYAYRPAYTVGRPVNQLPAYQYQARAYQAPAYQAQTAYYAPAAVAAPVAVAAYTRPATVAYYAPAPAGYAVRQQAVATYAQPYRVNYAPPTFNYRTSYARVPVTYYRPVVTYDPVTGTPVTCQMPTCGTECQTRRYRGLLGFGLLPIRPITTCGTANCATAPRVANCGTYTCGTAPTGCGSQPYYPAPGGTVITQPGAVITTPGTVITQPGVIPAVPSTQPRFGVPLPSGSTTVPPPPTRFGPTGSFPSNVSPADTQPRLNPGTVPPPATGTIFPAPSGYPPVSDPYQGSSSSASPNTTTPSTTTPSTTSNSVFGSGYQAERAGIRAPQRPERSGVESPTGPVLGSPRGYEPASSVQAVPDPEANTRPLPSNRAPQLLDPRDKTALGDAHRWAVVPAVWAKQPTREEAAPVSLREVRQETPAPRQAAPEIHWDDTGWKSAR